jgi:hypothetical protein
MFRFIKRNQLAASHLKMQLPGLIFGFRREKDLIIAKLQCPIPAGKVNQSGFREKSLGKNKIKRFPTIPGQVLSDR